ncbi:aminopeptidase N [Ponticoccus sp. SC2-23]|uniref:aminopeptidase N n=1 Tax=Alexandriicola marinus TaxID=2081710 RepID=UPI000FD6D552|nr:aminopeptidase N [Alexandriicola marinus]MBM1219454.1 aminopeptidase N [Ponticoccus sp. SC6-9]MBM1223474.1 aminopeptidase N [Ponticoccus sp. SC6-15]MBM1229267.1 aminopeptidase N [Ponticoccus sp. SC6-38]MBM1232440.1 aminopeptidase N [Ponticoccus sp. SC6-45]MBM1237610.1 aminopeptidase N [Ponticoccus sp. SC6-49]MBM1241451.1 aminopeptidase N [Ponticoccus sp. SC2-64]MBM1245964.1 aminopeptidase N [Ponticoccus sp. SC6-42]MBM1250442.1 aminopeptidase N [Ponticoccus sp. SC6-33]MBM1255619.1 aminop
MSPRQQTVIHLADYTPPAYLVDRVELVFRLDPRATRVVSRVGFRPNPDSAGGPFFLHGEELKLISARIDGEAVSPELTDRGLTCDVPDAPFVWEAEVEIAPADNTALEGLYMSNGMYCTQCEAEGFRRITYYPDRPDVMAPFFVRLEGDAPVLLSNGNPVSSGEGWAEWDDPWPKPAYLFALVAGELAAHSDSFVTKSGRQVALNIWVRPEDRGKCAFGMDALKRSMRWDEDVYGREYDLDIFNIVAVDDFNAGAMENKGLNIFNSALVLCSPETATDGDFERIEGVIAHEYFHNWTGNRITCRDWFQLCLKEGLTVFRDQQFTGDMRGHSVKRIRDALELRAYQFREDAGPLAHPVRPESFVEINNFYTATVYEKGAEVIGMLRRIVGGEGYEKALDLYFERHDGDAATIEDWLQVFEDATGEDLSQFALWYSQAGTPRLSAREDHDGDTFRLTLSQETSPTPGQPEKSPLHIPVAVGLLGQNGDEVVPTRILTLKEAEQTFEFTGLPTRPVASVLRGFSAPVILDQPRSARESAFLLAHDTDPFNAWEAGRRLAEDVLTDMILDGSDASRDFLDALDRAISDPDRDPAFRALLLDLPSEDDMAKRLFEAGTTPDPDLIHASHDALAHAIAERSGATLARLHTDHQLPGPFSPDARAAGNRALANAALRYLVLTEGPDRAQAQFETADNMTQSLAALGALVRIGKGNDPLARFEARWKTDRLVMNKWFGLQVSLAPPAEAVEKVQKLTAHPLFDWTNPNRFRSVLGAFAMNQAGFHRADGAGYDLLIDWLIRLDPRNPQVAARSVAAFQTISRWDDGRKKLMRQSLERLSSQTGLSADTAEMVNRILS